MFFYEGLSCPYCDTRFTETDDIVACPACGAPHHRACWKEHGVCAHADAHGTENEWSRDKASEHAPQDEAPAERHPCPNCGADNSPYAEMCSHCGRPLNAQEWSSYADPTAQTHNAPPFGEYAPFHTHQATYTGMSPNETVDGETVADLTAAVQTNTAYYLPRFRDMAQKNAKLSWNWAAFFLPSYWLLYRKQYVLGAVLLTVEIVLSTLTTAALYSYTAALGTVSSTAELVARLLEAARIDPFMQNVVHFIAAVGVMLLLIRLIVAMFGNGWYMSRTMRIIRRSREQYPEGYHAQLSAAGGTSFILALIGYMCMQTLPMMILMLIGV